MPDQLYQLGPDGEPEPVGNEAQRAAGRAVASTFVKNLEEKIKELEAKQAEQNKIPTAAAQVQPKNENKPNTIPAHAVKEVKVDQKAAEQEKANQAYKEAIKSATSPEPNKLGVNNVEVKAQGTYTPPQ